MKSNIRKTITLPPYGRIPVKDAKMSVTVYLTLENIRKGKKFAPNACAIALCNRENTAAFPGVFLASWVYKTATYVVTSLGGKIQALRYVHSAAVTKAINGF